MIFVIQQPFILTHN